MEKKRTQLLHTASVNPIGQFRVRKPPRNREDFHRPLSQMQVKSFYNKEIKYLLNFFQMIHISSPLLYIAAKSKNVSLHFVNIFE